MNTTITIHGSENGLHLCTYSFPDIGSRQTMSLTMEIPVVKGQSVAQIELAVLKKAHTLLGEMISNHPESKIQ